MGRRLFGKSALTKLQAIVIAIIVIVAVIAGVAYIILQRTTPTGSIKIGGLFSLTGAVPLMGRDQLDGFLMAIDDINNGEGAWKMLGHGKGVLGRLVEPVVEDDEATADVAVTKLRKLVLQDDIHFVIGLLSTGCTVAVMPKLPEYKCILFAYAHGVSLSKKYPLSGGWLFNLHVDSRIYGYGLIKAMKDTYPDVKSLAYIGPDYSYGWEVFDGVKEAVERLGWNVDLKDPIYVALGTREYGPTVTKILGMDVDGVIAGIYGDDLVTFIRQAKQYGLFEKVKFAATLTGGEIEALKNETPEGMLTMEVGLNCLYPDTPEMKEFRERFYHKFGMWPRGSCLETYGGTIILCHAIEKAGTTDVDKVRETLEGLTVKLPWSEYTIRDFDHQGLFECVVGKTGYSTELGGYASIPVYTFNTSEVVWTKDELEAIWAKEGLSPP